MALGLNILSAGSLHHLSRFFANLRVIHGHSCLKRKKLVCSRSFLFKKEETCLFTLIFPV
jgi:hypothetical protein